MDAETIIKSTPETTSDAFSAARSSTSSTPSAVTTSNNTPPSFEMTVDDPELNNGVTPDVALEKEVVKQDTKAEVAKVAPPVTNKQKPVITKAPPLTKKADEKQDLLADIKPTGTKAPPAPRDLSAFTPDEQAILKQMSNPAFEYTTKLIKEKKELESLKTQHYLQTEDGYMLTPEYKQTSEDVYYANAEANYWMQQLMKIDKGEEYQEITHWDANGQPILSAPKAPTKEAEERIRSAMNHCKAIAAQKRESLQQLPAKYKQIVQADNQIVKGKMAELFSWEKDPSILETSIDVNGKEIPIKQIKSDITNLFPPYHRNSIGVEAAANMFVALRIYANEIMNLKQQLEVSNIKKGEAMRAEPKSDAKPSAKSSKTINGVAEFNMDGLPTD